MCNIEGQQFKSDGFLQVTLGVLGGFHGESRTFLSTARDAIQSQRPVNHVLERHWTVQAERELRPSAGSHCTESDQGWRGLKNQVVMSLCHSELCFSLQCDAVAVQSGSTGSLAVKE